MKGKKGTKAVVTGLSAAVGSLAGSTGAEAAVTQLSPSDEDEVVVQHVENPGEVEVISYTNLHIVEPPHQEPLTESQPEISPEDIVTEEEYQEPGFIIEDVYAGPDPGIGIIESGLDEMEVIYGPPEPDVFSDYYTDDF